MELPLYACIIKWKKDYKIYRVGIKRGTGMRIPEADSAFEDKTRIPEADSANEDKTRNCVKKDEKQNSV